MTQLYDVEMQGPPLPSGVAVGDAIWVPVFACAAHGGAPFWARVTAAGPALGGWQDIVAVRIDPRHGSQPEADRTVKIQLPLHLTARRVFVRANEQPAVGRAPVPTAELPRRTGAP